MSEFDARAREWDKDRMHMDRSVAIAAELEKMIPINHSMKALEYGAGTGILSFLLRFIPLMRTWHCEDLRF